MALQVWLPLNGDLENKGLSSVTVTNSGAIVNTAGKIGSCYSFGDGTESTKGRGININNNFTTIGSSRSICAWVRPKGTHLHYTGAIASSGNWNTNNGRWVFGIKQNNGGFTGFDHLYSTYCSTTIPTNEWTHLCVTVEDGITKFYKNGVLIEQQSRGAGSLTSDASNTMVGRETYASGYFSFNGDINDVRIYDHCLSPKEVKEISKALILHYPLDDFINSGSVNLVANGWGGSDNWTRTGSTYISTDVPSSPTGITNSYYNDNWTKEFIPISQNDSYTISAYAKKYLAATCYISVRPYDIDKNRITYEQCNGLLSPTLTTLAQDLNPGDTIVYLTDASRWYTNRTHAYLIAIFGYKDSTGYTYSDLVYTRRVYSWGSTTDKSHLDIPNNRLTLNSPYTGDKIPAGTKVCQTEYGSTYWYPSYISASSAIDWTLLTKTFTPADYSYLKPARYITVGSMGSYQYLAGITLINNNTLPIVYDCSGYGNDGTITKAFKSAQVEGGRYKHCALFDSSQIYINHLPMYGEVCTLSCWINIKNYTPERSCNIIGGVYLTINDAGKLSGYSYGKSPAGYHSGTTTIPLNTWTHVALVWTPTHLIGYVNGIEDLKVACTGSFSSNDTKYFGIESTSGRKYNGYMNDIRIYMTVLSADDILELYNTSAIVDKNNFKCYELDETTNNMLAEQEIGILTKTWGNGLSSYTQQHCQCTLTDDGYRIYRTPDLIYSQAGTVMWGGFVIDNTNNRFNFQTGHTYMLQFEVKGQTSNSVSDIYWTNYVGWGGGETQCSPSNIVISNPVTANYNNSEWKTFTYKWTINDNVWKLCTSSYQSFVAGQYYVSYKGFKYGFGYKDTGSLGTDLYIRNIRMFDITNGNNIEIFKSGVTESVSFIEETIDPEITQGGLVANQFKEI